MQKNYIVVKVKDGKKAYIQYEKNAIYIIYLFSFLKMLNNGKKPLLCVLYAIFTQNHPIYVGLKLSKYKKVDNDQELLQSEPISRPKTKSRRR